MRVSAAPGRAWRRGSLATGHRLRAPPGACFLVVMPSKPPRTQTLPEGARPPSLDGPDLVTALRVHGGTTETVLLAKQATFTVGSSPSCDVVLESPYVSSLHVLLERRGQRIRVHDQNSRNGVFFAGRREPSFDIGPGDVFTVATTQLLALNEDMRLARPAIAEIVGFDRGELPDEILIAALRGGPLAIVGEAGCEHDRLAELVHATSLRRRGPLVHEAPMPSSRIEHRRLIDRAKNGTLILDVADQSVDPALLSLATTPEYRVRPVLVATSLEAAVERLGAATLSRMQHIQLRPLRERASDVPGLIDRMFLAHRASLRFTDLTQPNRDALLRHHWPANLHELRETVERLAALAEHKTIRKTSTALRIPRSTLQDWADRVGLSVPVVG